MQDDLNPYRPVETVIEPLADDVVSEASFVVTRGQLRQAEEQYLLRIHLTRLSVGSIAMIIASLFAIGWSTSRGGFAFLATSVASMAGSAIVYQSLVHRSKQAVRRRIPEIGIVKDAECSVCTTPEEFVFRSPAGEFRWANDTLKTFATSRGLLILPEPKTYVFVPRNSSFRDEDYTHFRKRVADRAER